MLLLKDTLKYLELVILEKSTNKLLINKLYVKRKQMSVLLSKFKKTLRELIPPSFQVPLKYYYNSLQSKVEPEMELLKYFVKKGDLTIDVGGNRGIYAYKLWQLGANIEVFEPNPTCIKVLNPWVSTKSGINLHCVGLSNTESKVNLHIPIDKNGIEHDASATIENIEFDDSRELLVSIKTLDSYQFSNVALVKIDVEGHESNVIDGASALLSTSQPVLLIEIEQRHNNVSIKIIFKKILEFGYVGFFFDGTKIINIESFDASKHQLLNNFENSKGAYINNFLFLNKENFLNGKFSKFVKDFELQRYTK